MGLMRRFSKFFPIISLSMGAICCHHPWQPECQSNQSKKPYIVVPSTWWCFTWNLITFGELTLEMILQRKCKLSTDGWTDRLGTPNYCHAYTSLWAFGSRELKREVEKARGTKSTHLRMFKAISREAIKMI